MGMGIDSVQVPIPFHDRLERIQRLSTRIKGENQELEGLWGEALQPGNPGQGLDARLKLEQLKRADLGMLALLDESADGLSSELHTILEAIGRAANARAGSPSVDMDDQGEAGRYRIEVDDQRLFVHAWLPAASVALQELRAQLLEEELRLITEEGWIDLWNSLLSRMSHVGHASLWALFREKTTLGACLLAQMRSRNIEVEAPPRTNYDDFIKTIWKSGYSTLWESYPVLARHQAMQIKYWIEGCRELIQRVCIDRRDLSRHMGIDSASKIVAVKMDMGDQHGGGRSVCRLSFGKDGVSKQLLYKPRDIRLQGAYHGFLQAVEAASRKTDGCGFSFLTPKTLARHGYGYVEWLTHKSCDSETEVQLFYRNMGRLLGVLYVLGGSDAHYENILAVGAQPVFVDAETLLEEQVNNGANTASSLSLRVRDSVMRTGLLPEWRPVEGGRQVIDMSALRPQLNGHQQSRRWWIGVNSDGMCMGMINNKPIGLHCVPTTSYEQQVVLHVKEIQQGCGETLAAIRQSAPQLLDALQAFEGTERRRLVRNTVVYAQIKDQLLTPKALKSWISQGLILEQLYKPLVHQEIEDPDVVATIKEEIRQLQNLDIPTFTEIISRREVHLKGTSKPSEADKNNSLGDASTRLTELDDEAIKLQVQLIAGTLFAAGVGGNGAIPNEAQGQKRNERRMVQIEKSSPSSEAKEDPLLKEAERICQQIWARAVFDGEGNPDWLGMNIASGTEYFRFGLMGASLYSGQIGLALVFGMLANLLAEKHQTSEAKAWANRSKRCLDLSIKELLQTPNGIHQYIQRYALGLSGLGGFLLTLQVLDGLELIQKFPKEQGYQSVADEIISRLDPEMIAKDEGLDIMSGSAGLVGALCRSKSPNAERIARACSTALIDSQHPGGGWQIRKNWKPLTGLSHGAAGITAALHQLNDHWPDAQLIESAQRGLEYEKSIYQANINNWPDFRFPEANREAMTAWCNGSPGIGLMRAALLGSPQFDQQCERELRSSLRKINEMLEDPERLMTVDSVCCGTFGLIAIEKQLLESLGQWRSEHRYELLLKLTTRARSQGSSYRLLRMGNAELELYGLFTGLGGVAAVMIDHQSKDNALGTILSAGLIKNTTAIQP